MSLIKIANLKRFCSEKSSVQAAVVKGGCEVGYLCDNSGMVRDTSISSLKSSFPIQSMSADTVSSKSNV